MNIEKGMTQSERMAVIREHLATKGLGLQVALEFLKIWNLYLYLNFKV